MPISKIKTSSITADAASVNLNIDAGTLFLDVANNRVGVGTTSAYNKLTIQGDATGASFADNGIAQILVQGLTDFTKRLGLGIDTTNNIGVIQAQKYGTGAYPLAINPAGGSVGIGTSSPSQKLTAVGNIKIAGAQNGNVGNLIFTRTDASWSINNETDLRFYSGSGDTDSPATLRMAVSSLNGNVGIANNSPATTLAIGSGAGSGGYGGGVLLNRGASVYNFYEANDGTNSVIFGLDNNLAYAKIGSVTSTPIALHTANTARLYITATGNVGVNINNPVTRLQVVDASGIGGSLTLGTDQAGVDGGTCTVNLIGSNNYFQGSHRNVSSPVARINMFPTNLGTDSQGAISFHTRNSNIAGNTLNEAMRIDSSGNLLLGDTSAQYSAKLYVNGSIAARHSGVDGTYANAFIAAYNGNYNEKNIIATAVSSGASSSGFRFLVSDGAGLATTTNVMTINRDAVRIVKPTIINPGSGQTRSENGVATWYTSGFTNNNSTITFDITVNDDNGSGTGIHIEANHTHINWGSYGAFLDTWVSTRASAIQETRDIFNVSSGNGGAWTVSKPNNTTLRVTKSAGSYPGGGYYWIKVTTNTTL